MSNAFQLSRPVAVIVAALTSSAAPAAHAAAGPIIGPGKGYSCYTDPTDGDVVCESNGKTWRESKNPDGTCTATLTDSNNRVIAVSTGPCFTYIDPRAGPLVPKRVVDPNTQ